MILQSKLYGDELFLNSALFYVGGDRNSPLDVAKSCIDSHTNAIRKICQTENEKFVAATSQLKGMNLESNFFNLGQTFGDICQWVPFQS